MFLDDFQVYLLWKYPNRAWIVFSVMYKILSYFLTTTTPENILTLLSTTFGSVNFATVIYLYT